MASFPPLPDGSPWHRGEYAIQAHVGVERHMDGLGRRVVRDHMPDQHRDFYAHLPFMLVGSVDPEGEAWATMIAGRPGFVASPDPRLLSIRAVLDPADPAAAGVADGRPIGLLGIEFETRRRNRANGTVRRTDAGFDVVVDQTFGACPRYIQLRDHDFIREPAEHGGGAAEVLGALDDEARRAITQADMLFVASYCDEGGRRQVDVSNRGGRAGFVRIEGDTLTVPEFNGNFFFATLGNILLNGKAGLLFADYETGDVLQLSGDAEIILSSPEVDAFQGAERFWTFRPRRIVRRRNALPLRWTFRADGWSPNALMTGDWQDAAARLRAAELAKSWRTFRVEKIIDESMTVRSFHLLPTDDGGLLPSRAGQHLPIRVTLPGEQKPVFRTYTLSSSPADKLYRISVKREAMVSTFLHTAIKVGDTIEARAPAGEFFLNPRDRHPAILLAAGIGITPILAMARQIVFENIRTRSARRARVIYGARTTAERAFDKELRELASESGGAVELVRVLSDPTGADAGDYERAGRIDFAVLSALASLDEAEVYMCGPGPFMQAVYDDLRTLGIPDRRIHAEAFGPSALKRNPDPDAPVEIEREPATGSVPVAFLGSGKEARWTPEAGSLLELAEERGLSPEFSCRNGSCGTCRTKVLKGAVAYLMPRTAACGPDEALICIGVPARPDDGEPDGLHLDL